MGFDRPTDGTKKLRNNRIVLRLQMRISSRICRQVGTAHSTPQRPLQAVQPALVENYSPRLEIVMIPCRGLRSRRIGKDTIESHRVERRVCITERDGVTRQSSNSKICPVEQIGCGLQGKRIAGSSRYLQVKDAVR